MTKPRKPLEMCWCSIVLTPPQHHPPPTHTHTNLCKDWINSHNKVSTWCSKRIVYAIKTMSHIQEKQHKPKILSHVMGQTLRYDRSSLFLWKLVFCCVSFSCFNISSGACYELMDEELGKSRKQWLSRVPPTEETQTPSGKFPGRKDLRVMIALPEFYI